MRLENNYYTPHRLQQEKMHLQFRKCIYFTLLLSFYPTCVAGYGTLGETVNYDLKPEASSKEVDNPILLPLYKPPNDFTSPPSSEVHLIKRYPVAGFDFDHVAAPFIITAWIFAACCAKIAFHVNPKLANLCPESCMLLVVGVVLGLVLFHSGMVVGPLTPTVFFLFMLPPIVFDAGYFMPNRLFFDNIITILVYAVIGTVWNAMSIGVSLWAIGLTGIFGYEVPIMDMLLFSSIVSAVDPVAVLAVFEEIHVNEVLYIIVFGESLLNDAVTVVLYHMFEGYTEMGIPNLLPIDYFSGIASFFVVSIGGTLIGILFGLLTAFLSKYTTPVAVIEPMFPFIMGYLSYLTAEMFHLSGILSLVFCGITMKNYVKENISNKSYVTVKYVTKMLATASETIIFVVLGVSTVNDNHEWNTWFVLFSIIFCSVYRAIGVIILSAWLNRFRLHELNGVEQFIMSYGGLRGAVAFALALIIDEKVIPSKNMMVTTIIAVVYFTVFVQGMTIKFFVRILKVSKKSDERTMTMNERLHSTVIDHLLGGIEEVADQFFGNNKMRDRFKFFNNKYLRRILTNNSQVNEPKIFETHSKLSIMEAMNSVHNGKKSTLDPNASFSKVFRNYTEANLNRLAPEETNAHDNPAFLNLDMAEITYSPSFKDLNDSQIHHILEDAMFKPAKRPRRYSHSQFYENEPRHPPFHHHMRMQIRRLVSESRKRRKRNKALLANGVSRNEEKLPVFSKVFIQSGPNHPQVTVTSAREAESDDDGITFTVPQSVTPPSETEDSPQRTITETVLPWKRDDDIAQTDPAKPQEEFPTWVDNRDHYPGYLSPTPTFLESLNDLQPESRDIIHQPIEEEDDDCFEPDKSQPKPGTSKPFERPSYDQVEEDIIKQVMQEAWKTSSHQSQEERRQQFRNSGRSSPGMISLISTNSGEFSRPTTGISVECPDVVLDLEDDSCETVRDTKL